MKKIELRRRLRRRFMEVHREIFHNLFLLDQELTRLGRPNKYYEILASDDYKRLGELARKQIGYSKNTGTADIINPMRLKYRKTIVHENK